MKKKNKDVNSPIGLKELAVYLGLSPATVSLVLNDSPVAKTIPKTTRDRVTEAAEKFNYRPNQLARSLRAQRSFTLGVLVPEVSDGYSAMVLNGIEECLLKEGYFYFVASHRHRSDLIEKYPSMYLDRRIDGLILVDTPCKRYAGIPTVAVSGHDEVEGVVNIILNHDRAAELALTHLYKLGHRKIAIIKGQEFSSDTNIRYKSIVKAAKELGLTLKSKLTDELIGDSPSPELGYTAMKRIMSSGESFTALFAFNDVSAIGAIRAIREGGLSVPEDVSVIGFDDIYNAQFYNPALTTVRQPLQEMGTLAARTILDSISGKQIEDETITVEPELIIRQSTMKI